MRRLALTLLATLTLAVSLPATTLQKLSLDDMIQQSSRVVRARVTGARTALRGADIFTFYQIQVIENWKSDGPQLEVAVPGGAARGVRQTVAGAPQLQVGEEYVLFLWTSRSGLTQVMGLGQGLFSVKADASGTMMLIRPAAAETMLDQNGRVVADQPLNLKLNDVRQRVGQAAK